MHELAVEHDEGILLLDALALAIDVGSWLEADAKTELFYNLYQKLGPQIILENECDESSLTQ